MEKKLLERYARLLTTTGVNLQKGQEAVIAADVSNAYFVKEIVEAAYDRGASNVTVNWSDENVTKAKYLRAADSQFDHCPEWMPVYYDYYDDRDACYIHVGSGNPDLLKDASPDRIRRWTKAQGTALTNHRKKTMENHVRWTVGAVASVDWARKVFPGLSDGEAMDRLWHSICRAARIDEDDPIGEWDKHIESFRKRVSFLKEKNFAKLRFKNSLGTDITLELPDRHIWAGGAEECKKGILFSPNIPTEEIFTIPKKTGVNGKVVSSMPLSYNGVLIEGFSFEFVDGKVVDFHAEKNKETLGDILNLDEGARYLGEIALVPFNSPISEMNILFYNTLFDENASCHFALGKAYPCVEGYENMTPEEVEKAGINDSITHVDFMVGTSDMSIVGIGFDGAETPVFVNGVWA